MKNKKNKLGKLICSWDTNKILEEYAKDLLADNPQTIRDYLGIQKAHGVTEEDVWKFVSDDYINWDDEWEYITDRISELISERSKDDYWYVEVSNFGWENRSGYSFMSVENGSEFLEKILPRCDCTFKVYEYGEGLAIQNYHHDSPVGNEWYYCYPITEEEYENKCLDDGGENE